MTDEDRRKLRHAGDSDDDDYESDQGLADRLADRIYTGNPSPLTDDVEDPDALAERILGRFLGPDTLADRVLARWFDAVVA